MATKKFKVKLSSITKEIDRATKELKKIRKHLSAEHKKKVDLHMKSLASAKSLVSPICNAGRMTASFSGPSA
jgi:hypothetical protein